MIINASSIGIECVFQSYKDIWEILKFRKVDFGKYQFSVIFENMIDKIPKRFSPQYFNKLISNKEILNFATFHLYLPTDKNEYIITYDDFLSSKCEMIVLIYDTCYLEMYCKNHSWLEIIYNNAVDISGSVVEIKTRENDQRIELIV